MRKEQIIESTNEISIRLMEDLEEEHRVQGLLKEGLILLNLLQGKVQLVQARSCLASQGIPLLLILHLI